MRKTGRYVRAARTICGALWLSMGLGLGAVAWADDAAAGSGQGGQPTVIERTGKALERGATKTAHAIERGATKTGKALERGVSKTGKAIERGGKAVDRGVTRAARKIGVPTSVSPAAPPPDPSNPATAGQ